MSFMYRHVLFRMLCSTGLCNGAGSLFWGAIMTSSSILIVLSDFLVKRSLWQNASLTHFLQFALDWTIYHLVRPPFDIRISFIITGTDFITALHLYLSNFVTDLQQFNLLAPGSKKFANICYKSSENFAEILLVHICQWENILAPKTS